ncbi:MAG: DUF262 domain-containing HNH endonuclease family protein [Atribacterota bacterium]|jgi:hypothetical protein|nr:DUF262 domain-containing HNH endonuclease family protein [Atribacterota bacterium]
MIEANEEPNKLCPELLSIGKLLNGEQVYTVPIYQRNYAWQWEQITQMLDDIKDVFEDTDHVKSYFLGNLIVSKPPASTNYEVIDGQQRLTTLYLLLGLLGQKSHLGRLQYESRPHATAALEHIAHETSPSATTPMAEQHSEDAGIREGNKVIDQYLKGYIKDDALKGRFTQFVLEHVTVVRATLPASTDLNRYFEIMNTRGQQLQQVDIVKARLMAHLEGDAERACFAWIWSACADMDAYVQMTLTSKDMALRQKVFGDNWSFVQVGSFDDLLNIHKTAEFRQSNEGRFDKARGLTDAINEYSQMGIVENLEDEDTVRFRSIITFPSFLLHVLKIVQGGVIAESEGHLDDKALVKAFGELFKNKKTRDEQRATAKRFAFELLRCRNLFDSYVIKRKHTGAYIDEGDWSLKILLKKEKAAVYRNTYSIDKQEKDGDDTDVATKELLMLESMLRVTYTSPRTMHWITRLLRLLVDKQQGTEILDKSILISELENYARGKIKVTFFDPDEQPKGFGIERIVFTYLDYLLWKDDMCKKADIKASFEFSFRNSIEHFYPQNPRAGQNGSGTVSPEYLHCLGNLALLSVSDNSRFSNDLPVTKADFEKITNQSPKLERMARIAKTQQWGDQEVCDHHKEMVKLLNDDIEKYIETQKPVSADLSPGTSI